MADNTNIPFGDLGISKDDLFRGTAVGSIATAYQNNIYGINHRQTPLAVPMNRDNYGYTFFTRPQLNFSTPNLRIIRQMIPLLTTRETSALRAIRCLLDPRLGRADVNTGQGIVTCPAVDNLNPFIPILSNHLISLNGWPDQKLDTWTSKEGVYRDSYSMVDGAIEDYSTYDIQGSWRNSQGDIITALFRYWEYYMSKVFEGVMVPYGDYVISNVLDYNTRIYRLVMDPTKRIVQKISACGAAFPTSAPIGAPSDAANDKPYNDSNETISVQFRATGYIWNDPYLIHAFNRTVSIFNPAMFADEEKRSRTMVKIPVEYLEIFNNRGIPYIDVATNELQWWLPKQDFDKRLMAFKNLSSKLGLDYTTQLERIKDNGLKVQ